MNGARPIPEVRTVVLIQSRNFAGWTCSRCAWRWPHQDSTSSDRIRESMQYAFATHACEHFGVAASWRPLPAWITAWAKAIRTEESMAVLIASASMIWTVQLVTDNFTGIPQIGLLPPGPAEMCAIGVLVWLHAKWRRLVKTAVMGQAQAVAVE